MVWPRSVPFKLLSAPDPPKMISYYWCGALPKVKWFTVPNAEASIPGMPRSESAMRLASRHC
jgi:hypothetical protein